MLITSKFPGACLECQKEIKVGDRVSWERGQRGARHALCSFEGRQLAAKIAPSAAISLPADSSIELPCPEGREYLGYQRAGIAYALAHTGTIIADEMGLGKQQPVVTPVLTPSGWRMIGELSVGDRVIGSDGRSTSVTGIFPQGVKPSFEVEFSDGSKVEAGPDHLWTILYRKDGRTFASTTMTTDELRVRPKRGRRDFSKTDLYLPMLSAPIEFDVSAILPIESYTLGALIANGCLNGKSAVLTANTRDLDEIRERVQLGKVDIRGGCFRASVIGVIGAIRELALNVLSNAKFIPTAYLMASPKDRIDLLQGLLDGDGSISKTRNRIVYHTISPRLAQDVRELVEGLGGIASVRSYDRTAEDKTIEYQVRIRVPAWVTPFTVTRKADRYTPGPHCVPCRTVKTVRYVRNIESVCIAVAAADRLYVTEHCILTHNTIQAIGVINASPEIKTVLVVCPASLKVNWRNELRAWLTAPGARDLETISLDPKSPSAITIINYDILKKLPASATWDLLILDEAHYVKNPKAARTKAIFALRKRCKKVLCLTGTPILNRPVEIWPMLQLTDPATWDPPGMKGQAIVGEGEGAGFFRFAKRYCDAKKLWFGHQSHWDFSGASNLPELQEKLRASCMVRRLKKDVLKELPPKRRQVITLPLNGKAAEVAAELELFDGDMSDLESAKKKLAFTEISKARRELAVKKVDAVIEHVRDALESSDKIILFAHHHEVVARLYAELGEFSPVVITGETDPRNRQDYVDVFQNDPKCRLFIGSIGAAGVGLTLTAASHVIFAEIDWVPANMTQAEDRAHRIGQSESVLVQVLVVEGSLDSRMIELIQAKQMVADLGLDLETMGDVSDRKEVETREARRAREARELGISAEEIATVHAQLQYLAERCDGAQTQDGQGFNGLDTAFGKALAACASLSPKQALFARKMLVKYKWQLERMPESYVTLVEEASL